MDSANWALQTSQKFTTGVKYQFHEGFRPDQRSRNPIYPPPPPIQFLTLQSSKLLTNLLKDANVLQPLMFREREFQHREDDTEYDVEYRDVM